MDVTNVLILAGPLRANCPSTRSLDLARELAINGPKVEVFTSGGMLVEKFRRARVPVFEHRSLRPGWLNSFLARPVLARARQFQPQIIHCQSFGMSRLAAKLARACRCVYIVTGNSCAEAGKSRRLHRSRRFRGIIAASEAVRQDLVNAAGISKQRIKVIPSGIDAGQAAPPGNRRQVTVVGMIAPLVRGEGLEDFLEAARLLADRTRDVQFVVGGDGSLSRRLHRRSRDLNLEKLVTFASRFADYQAVLSAVDILVVPAISDGGERLVLEAIACRKPIVATGAGALPGIIKDGETGLLVHKNSPGEIAQALGSLLDNPDLAHRLAAGAVDWVRQNFSACHMVEETLAFYEEAASEEVV